MRRVRGREIPQEPKDAKDAFRRASAPVNGQFEYYCCMHRTEVSVFGANGVKSKLTRQSSPDWMEHIKCGKISRFPT
jgi:hypothetical protein